MTLSLKAIEILHDWLQKELAGLLSAKRPSITLCHHLTLTHTATPLGPLVGGYSRILGPCLAVSN